MPGKDINNNRRWYSRITKMALNRNVEENEEERDILSAIPSLKFNFLVFHYAHPLKMLLIT
jgi:hypothetical protein